MPFPSASQLGRAMKCPISNVLPKVIEAPSESSERGTAIHEYLADVVSGVSPAEAISRVPTTYQDACDNIDLERIPKLELLGCELSIAYDPFSRNGRVIGQRLVRDYRSCTGTEFPGTADRIGIGTDGILVVDDFKTGFSEYAGEAFSSWQLRLLAVGAIAAFPSYRGDSVRVGHIHTEGSVRLDYAEFDAFELASIRDDLERFAVWYQGIQQRLGNGGENSIVSSLSAVTGGHCQYCPSFNACPAKVGLLKCVISAPNIEVDNVISMLTAENAAAAYNRYKAVRQVMARMEAALRVYATERPIEVSPGVFYAPRDIVSEEVDGKVVAEVLEEKYGKEVAKNAVTMDASKESIKRATKSIAEKGKHASMVREVLAEVAARGGINVVRKTRVEEHRRQGQLDAYTHGQAVLPVGPKGG